MYTNFSTSRKTTVKYPTFDYVNPGTWDKYQKRMKTELFSLSSEQDPIQIDRTVDNWIALANNGTLSQCTSMYSVIAYFYPKRIAESYFKERISYFYNTLREIITNKAEGVTTKSEPTVPPTNVETPKPKPVAKPVAEKVSLNTSTYNFDTEFPTFTEEGFPDSNSDVFKTLLKESKADGESK